MPDKACPAASDSTQALGAAPVGALVASIHAASGDREGVEIGFCYRAVPECM